MMTDGTKRLSAGVAHRGRFGSKMRGVLRSATFTIEKPYILYRLCGRNAQVRLIVDGYVMDNFTELLFEGLSFKVNTGESRQWHSQSVARYLGHRAHIELIDAGDGFLAVDEIRFADAAAADAPDDSIAALVLSRPDVDSTESLAKTFGDICAEQAVVSASTRSTAVVSTAVVSTAVVSTAAATGVEPTTDTPTTDTPTTDISTTDTQETSFPWTLLLVLAPLPLILLVLLRKR